MVGQRSDTLDEGCRGQECVGCRELVEDARKVLVATRAFSGEEANEYMYELAEARRMLVVDVAERIVAGEWIWAEGQ